MPGTEPTDIDGSGASHRILLTLMMTAAMLLVVSVARREGFGVDVTDEAFSVAMPYEFALGNRPFADERALQQTAGILVTPLAIARMAVKGDSEGIVLFFRHAYLLLALGTSAATYVTMKRWVRREAAAAAALLPIAFIPFSIPSLTYNTMGALFLTIGTMAGAASVRTRSIGAAAAIQVIALALAAVSYPTMIVAVAAALTITVVLHVRRGTLAKYVGPAVIAGLLVVGCVAVYAARVVSAADVKASIEHTRGFGVHGFGWSKIGRLLAQISRECPYGVVPGWEILALVAIGTVGPRRLRGISICGVLLLVPAVPLDGLTTSHLILAAAAVALLPPVVGAIRGTEKTQALMAVWVPSLIAGATTAYTSSNGIPNAAIGLLPAAAIAVAFAIETASEGGLFPVALCASLALPAALHLAAWKHVYREDGIPLLTTRIETGPFGGLRTTASKALFLTEVQRDVRAAALRSRSSLFYDDFPAGYLFSAMRPIGPSVWIPGRKGYPAFDRMRYVRFFTSRQPDVVFEMRSIPMSTAKVKNLEGAGDPLRRSFWKSGYRVAVERKHYTVNYRCPTCSSSIVDLENLAPLPPGENYTAKAAEGWTWYETDADEGRAAITTRTGAVLGGVIPGFRAGNYEVDLSFFSYGPEKRNVVTVRMGDSSRELTFGPGCAAGIFRFNNVGFRDVRDPHFEFRAAAIGQPALILDTAVFRRLAESEPSLQRSECLGVGEEMGSPYLIEAERMKGAMPGDYRANFSKGWAVFEQPGYSGEAAALTSLPGAELRQRLKDDLKDGRYEVTVGAYNYEARASNEVEVRIGKSSVPLRIGGGGSSPGMTQARCVLQITSPATLVLRALSIGQSALLIDAITLRRLPGDGER